MQVIHKSPHLVRLIHKAAISRRFRHRPLLWNSSGIYIFLDWGRVVATRNKYLDADFKICQSCPGFGANAKLVFVKP
jgi:hypothetical protein